MNSTTELLRAMENKLSNTSALESLRASANKSSSRYRKG